jgi:hypothetical protein
MALVPKQKSKGGKPVSSPSSIDQACLQNAAALAEFASKPSAFNVFTIVEDVGVSKKSSSAEYTLKVSSAGKECAVFVPRHFLTKNGKLALREMTVGARIAVVSKVVSRQVDIVSFGVSKKTTVSDVDLMVAAVLP